jgi:hypothetical protein
MSIAASAIAAYGIPSRHALPENPLDTPEFMSMLATCEHHRLLGLLAAAACDGALPVDASQHDALEELFQAWLAHCVRLERLLLDAVTALREAGIPVRVLKGVALAHTAYQDPSYRVFGDVDLLVPSEMFTHTVAVLHRELRTERGVPELRPGFDQRFGKEALLRGRDLELDLHRTFVEGAFGLTVDLDDLFSSSRRFVLADQELDALPMPQQFLHACYAAALGDWPPKLGALRDVAQLLDVAQPESDDVLEMAARWRAEPVVASAVTSAWHELALVDRPPIVDWAHAFRPTRMDRILLSSHSGRGRAHRRHVAALLVIPGTSSKLAYLRAIAFPQRSYLAARRLTSTQHAKRALRAVLK